MRLSVPADFGQHRPAKPANEHGYVKWLIVAGILGVLGAGALAFGLSDSVESELPPLFSSAATQPTANPSASAAPAATASASAALHADKAPKQSAAPETHSEKVVNDTYAHVTVRCTPVCLVLLNGRRLGASPVTDRRVSPGHYKVVAYRDDVGGRSKRVHLKAGTLSEIDFDMH